MNQFIYQLTSWEGYRFDSWTTGVFGDNKSSHTELITGFSKNNNKDSVRLIYVNKYTSK